LAWKFERPLQHLVGLPLAVGVALAEVLAACGQPVQLKWPNDVLQDGAKLAGVLIETAAARQAAEGATWAVIGIGLNLALPAALRSQFNSASATALLAIEREQLVALLLDHLSAALFEFEREGFAAFAARWNACHAYAGQAVKILDRGAVLHEGIAAGVDADGRLQLDTAAGRIAVMAGDVSLRLRDASPARSELA
jgi:BirA family biotin operon repressor/biotin-[acetyl-CoA-carboxylase] ligase